MPMPVVKITKKKDGREVAWFRETAGRVRTRAGEVDWVRAEQIRELAEYGIWLQIKQAEAGLGSDGMAMPPLKGSGRAEFAGRVNGRATFRRRSLYAEWKIRSGLRGERDLRGPGRGGVHMLDSIRINYLDDRMARFGITTREARIRAVANEKRAPWYGWSPASVTLMGHRGAQIFPQGMAEALVSLGLMSAQMLLATKWRKLRRAA